MLQPAWMRAASVVTDSGPTVATGLRLAVNRTVVASEAAFNILPALLSPAAVVALGLGLWRVTADLGWTETFPISHGLFSHWQVWIALAIALNAAAASFASKIKAQRKVSGES
jgi:hypothetical protein